MGKSRREKEERRQLLRRVTDIERANARGAVSEAASPQFVARVQGTVFQGPLPPPEILAGYDEVLPGAADRIVAMAEKNQAHRHALEAKVIPAGIASERLGQILAFVLYLATLGSGTYLVAEGKETIGVIQMLGTTATFAAIYIKGQRAKKRELQQKRPA
jgi:uncharacterized membrane protein